jgi:FkbM family methyltransferase
MAHALKSLLKRSIPDTSLVRLRALDYRLHAANEYRLLETLCDRSKCSIDVGANVGVLTYWLAKRSAHTYAYEPNPELATKLRRSFKSSVTVVEAALSDAPGSTVLRVPSYDGVEMHGLASIAQTFKDADGVREFTVPVRRLDDEQLTNVGFVKIDVEQNEEKVLRGGMQLFAREMPSILLEVCPKLYSKPLVEFLADVLALGYRGYFLFDRKLLKLEDYRMDRHNDGANYGVADKYMTNVVLSTRALATA